MQTLEATGQLTWRRLLLWAGGLDLATMAVIGLVFRDKEALAFAGLFAVAVALLALRSGPAGAIMIGILAANTAAWMAPATASNLMNREQLADVMIPASLTAISLTGAAAAVISVVKRRTPDADGRAVRIVAQVAIAVLVLAAGAGLVRQGEGPIKAGDPVVIMRSASFEPATLTLDAEGATLGITNRDLFWHTFTIDELDVNVGLPTRAERRLSFDATPGSYTFYCAVPGHRQLGMEGTLIVR